MKWTMQQKGNNLCVPNNNNNIDKTKKKNREKTFYCLVAERE
jgi:hypothetical protein